MSEKSKQSQVADPRLIAVIVGVGEVSQREFEIEHAKEPISLMVEAAMEAETDAGVAILKHVDRVEVVGQITWPYSDAAQLLCSKLQITPHKAINESFGGDTPLRLIDAAARRIAAGNGEVTLIVGGEATKSLREARKAKAKLAWTEKPPKEARFKHEFEQLQVHKTARRLGVTDPSDIYPLFENASANRLGVTPAAAVAEAAQIWAEMSVVATDNKHAWLKTPRTAYEVAEISDQNRMIALPYRKLMVANPVVNQGAAIIVTSLAKAETLGVDTSQLIYILSGAAAREPEDFMLRESLDRSVAQEQVLNAAVDRVGGDASTFDCVELYSCFPVVPKLALEVLEARGMSSNMPVTVTGGLTFFGGPLNNYMSHAAAAMVRNLRRRGARTGLLYGQGGVMTKHQTLVLSVIPEAYSSPAKDDAQNSIEPRGDCSVADGYQGEARIESYTVQFGAMGRAKSGIVILRTPEDKRVIARVRKEDDASMELLNATERSPVGAVGHTRVDAFGDLVWEAGLKRDRRKIVPQFCKVERRGAITIVTINRPKAMNSLTPRANEELSEIFDEFQSDPDQWVAIVTGAGKRAFSTGNDLKYTASAVQNGERPTPPKKGFAGLTARWDLNKPVIAAVNGAALGGGLEIALACDIIIAARHATFALPEPKVGLAALAGGLQRLPRQIGMKRAMGMILTGRTIAALEAFEIGLVNEVVDQGSLLDTAVAWAEQILLCSPMATRASKEIVSAGMLTSSIQDEFETLDGLNALKALYRSSDIREGPRAFAEKRPPKWKGV